MKTEEIMALSVCLARIIPVVAGAAFIASITPGPAFSQEKSRPVVTENAVSISPAEADWMPCPEGSPQGCEIAVLSGDLATGKSHILYRTPAGSTPFPTFWHSGAEHFVMIQGELIGTGKDDEKYGIGPGTYWYIPAGMIHGGVRCSEEGPCMWYEYFEEPWDSNVVEDGVNGEEKQQ